MNTMLNNDDVKKLEALTKLGNTANDPAVDHPNHYQLNCGVEVIDIMEDVCSHYDGKNAVSMSNVIKYILRAHSKNGLQDLKKARRYLDRLIRNMEENSNG